MSACLIILSCRHMIHCWRRRPFTFFLTIIQGSTEQQQVMGEIKELSLLNILSVMYVPWKD
uniref:Uncharacterized protein n=1 Tax=Anguilla anguilla TaxID=7936 RepID=A0A0E9TLU3_ANGAN